MHKLKKFLSILTVFVLLPAAAFSAKPVPPTGWTTVYSQDQDIVGTYMQCNIPEYGPTGMSENDEWYFIQDGVLGPGQTWRSTNPRPLCISSEPVRIAWRFIGNGAAPNGIVMKIIDPVNGATYRADTISTVTTKGGKPAWVRQCTNVGGSDGLGTYTFEITNTGTSTAKLRVAASIVIYEFEGQQCPNWSQTLSNYGI